MNSNPCALCIVHLIAPCTWCLVHGGWHSLLPPRISRSISRMISPVANFPSPMWVPTLNPAKTKAASMESSRADWRPVGDETPQRRTFVCPPSLQSYSANLSFILFWSFSPSRFGRGNGGHRTEAQQRSPSRSIPYDRVWPMWA